MIPGKLEHEFREISPQSRAAAGDVRICWKCISKSNKGDRMYGIPSLTEYLLANMAEWKFRTFGLYARHGGAAPQCLVPSTSCGLVADVAHWRKY
jgi:hypothetical protein